MVAVSLKFAVAANFPPVLSILKKPSALILGSTTVTEKSFWTDSSKPVRLVPLDADALECWRGKVPLGTMSLLNSII